MMPFMEITPAIHAEIIEAAKADGATVQGIAKAFGVHPQIIRRWLTRPIGYVARNGRPPKLAAELLPEDKQ